jgi:hypothetical protein
MALSRLAKWNRDILCRKTYHYDPHNQDAALTIHPDELRQTAAAEAAEVASLQEHWQ